MGYVSVRHILIGHSRCVYESKVRIVTAHVTDCDDVTQCESHVHRL